MLDQAAKLRSMFNEKQVDKKKTRFITVTSGKGGVGKSNFVVNLGISLQMKGYKVLIFDADIGMGNDDVLMGVIPKYNIFNIIDGMEVEDVITKGPLGISLLSGGSSINNIEDLSESQRKIFLEKLKGIEEYDYVLMDTGAGINRSVLAFIASSEELILVTTPEPTSLTDAYSLLKATKHFKIKDRAKVVINMTLDKSEGDKTYKKFKTVVDKFLGIELEYLGDIQEDKKLILSVRSQKPFIMAYPNSNASKGIIKIREKIEKKEENFIENKGVFKRLLDIFS